MQADGDVLAEHPYAGRCVCAHRRASGGDRYGSGVEGSIFVFRGDRQRRGDTRFRGDEFQLVQCLRRRPRGSVKKYRLMRRGL